MFISESSTRQELTSAIDMDSSLFEAVLDFCLENDCETPTDKAASNEIDTNDLRNVVVNWIEDGDECYKN